MLTTNSCGTIFIHMNLNSHLQLLVSDTTASAAGIEFRCTSGNFRWECAVADGRAEEYNTYVGEVATHKNWKAEHKGYVDEFVYVAKDFPRSADCFLAIINTQAQLNENLDNTFLLRLESLSRLFADPLTEVAAENFWTRFFNSQKDLKKAKLTDDAERLRTEFVDQWNELRVQARPMFATFLNEFGGNLDNL